MVSIPQRDFSWGVIDGDFIERSDTEIRARSVMAGKNLVIQKSGSLTQRDGFTDLIGTDAEQIHEINPDDGLRFGILFTAGKLLIVNDEGETQVQFTGQAWGADDLPEMWVASQREDTLFGAPGLPIHVLHYDDGVWELGEMAFNQGPGSTLEQPYWPFNPGVTITPSALTGSITIAASDPVFTAAYVGLRIRYEGREILVTSYSNPSKISGTVQQKLPPTHRYTVGDASGFSIGEVVSGTDTSAEARIVAISGNDVDAIVTSRLEGFDVAEDLVGPSHSSTISARNTSVTPAASEGWDEPLFSSIRGYPGWGTFHQNRLVLVNLPQMASGVVMSTTSTFNSFKVGSNDADAIVDRIRAADGPRILFAISAEDLLFIMDKGCYYQITRDGTAITPTGFSPIKFDSVGAADVRPVQINDGVAFVDRGGESIMGAVLRGEQFRAWTSINISEAAQDLFNGPITLGTTEFDDSRPERYVYTVNSDGTAVILRLDRESGVAGWIPWDTDGSFVWMASIFGRIHALVDRTINGSTARRLERLTPGLYLDAARSLIDNGEVLLATDAGLILATAAGLELVADPGSAAHLAGTTAHLWNSGRYDGTLTVDAAGEIDDLPALENDAVIGRTFDATISPWPPEVHDAKEVGFKDQAWSRIAVAVKDTIAFSVGDERIEAYDSDDDVTAAPSRKSGRYIMPVQKSEERGDGPQTVTIDRGDPGPFTVTAIFCEVT